MVIQRWQSVLLLITVALMACFTFLSLGQVQTTDYTYNFTCLGFTIEGQPTDGSQSGTTVYTWFLFMISLASTILPFITIFLFKKLPLQKKLCLFEIVLLLAVIGIAGFEGYCEFPGTPCQWSTLIIAPFLSLIAVVMAWTRINKDHNLLRSVYRIR